MPLSAASCTETSTVWPLPERARAGQPEVRERHVYEVRMTLLDLGGREAVAALALGAEVLDQHVGALAELAEAAPAAGVVQVEHRAALVRVAVEERQRAIGRGDAAREGRNEAPRVAARRLDLDHLGAQVGEEPPRECAAEVGQVDDAEVSEGRRHGAPLLCARPRRQAGGPSLRGREKISPTLYAELLRTVARARTATDAHHPRATRSAQGAER
jgi:hypothetical protein